MGDRNLSKNHRETGLRLLRLSAMLIGVVLIANITAEAQRFVRTEMAGGSGGRLSEYICGSGRVLVGVQGYAGVWLDNIQAICAKVDANGLTETRPEGPVFGGNRPINGAAQCPGDGFVITATVMETEKNPYVGRINIYCRGEQGFVTLRGTGHLRGYKSPVGSSPSNDDAPGYTIGCENESVAVGISVRTSNFVDAFGLICGRKPVILNKRKKPTPTEVGKARSKDSTDRTILPGVDKPADKDEAAQPGPSGTSSQPPSADINHPTSLTSNELKGELREKAADNFYTLTVGPGEVVFTLKVNGGKPGGGVIYFYLLNPETRNSESDFWLFGPAGGSDQVIKKIDYPEKRTIILKKNGEIGTGSWHLSISGAVNQ